MPRLALVLLLTAISLTSQASAQTPSQSSAPDTPTFEVAAIKLNNTGDGNSGTNFNGRIFTATNVSLKHLLTGAYDISPSRILGGPKWLDSSRFDIQAKLDEATAAKLDKLSTADHRSANQAIFQQLTADRFGLKVHWETRELPIYALIPTKSGAKTETGFGSGLKPSKDPKGGSGTSSSGHNSSVEFKATNVTLVELAQSLTNSAQDDLGRTVIDQTNIPGKFDITLTWTRESERSSRSSDSSAQETGPTIFTAIQEQLGLKLESTKGPVKVLVIDEASLPTEN
jgi:uncharacterized protein (TIGR03435 family)